MKNTTFGFGAPLRISVGCTFALFALTALLGCAGDTEAEPDTVGGDDGRGIAFQDTSPGPAPGDDTISEPEPPPPCEDSFDCPLHTPFCDQATGLCVECRSNSDCGGTACIAGACAEGSPRACTPDTKYCAATFSVSCGPDGREESRVDCRPGICLDGECLVCRPGALSCDDDNIVRCRPDGGGHDVYQQCLTDGGCHAGACVECRPGTGRCADGSAVRCKDDGSGWDYDNADDCRSRGLECLAGSCSNPCIIDPKFQSNVGCEFWAVDLKNAYVESQDGRILDAQNAQFAVIASNTASAANALATVTITFPDGRTLEETVGPRDLATFLLPPDFGLWGSSLDDRAFHIQSTRPVTVAQFNPFSNEDVFSNDASILLPTPSLGREYYAVSHMEAPPFHGYFTIVASEPGDTEVTVTPTTMTAASADGRVPAMSAGVAHSFTLAQGQVLNIESNEIYGDLTGSHIVASQNIVVFSGHEAAVTSSSCCADHLEQQMLPVSRWGTHYIAATSQRRFREKDHWVILASAPGTKVNLSPRVHEMPATLDPGVPVRFTSDTNFVVSADKPILVAQYLASSGEVKGGTIACGQPGNPPCPPKFECINFRCQEPQAPDSCVDDSDCPRGFTCATAGIRRCWAIGDPTLILTVPTAQYRREYVFLTPDKYLENYVTIVAPTGAEVQLDGALIPEDQFTLVPTSTYSVHHAELGHGVHVLVANAPVGIVVHGYDKDVSYGYPGGLGLENLYADEQGE